MNYAKLASQLKDKIVDHADSSSIEISLKEAYDYYLALMALDRIKKISESENGGCDLFS